MPDRVRLPRGQTGVRQQHQRLPGGDASQVRNPLQARGRIGRRKDEGGGYEVSGPQPRPGEDQRTQKRRPPEESPPWLPPGFPGRLPFRFPRGAPGQPPAPPSAMSPAHLPCGDPLPESTFSGVARPCRAATSGVGSNPPASAFSPPFSAWRRRRRRIRSPGAAPPGIPSRPERVSRRRRARRGNQDDVLENSPPDTNSLPARGYM